ncbi:hypothetical protein OAD19_02845 [Octadecabacter sp.]|nr:hypothetical protein [Octadecabacter sp.]
MNEKTLIDAFMFHNEFDLLEARIELLKDTVDYFCIVESSHTFTGLSKSYRLERFLIERYGQQFYNSCIFIYKNDHYITSSNYEDTLLDHSGTLLADELKYVFRSLKADKYTWLNDLYQREMLKVSIDQCVQQKKINTEDLFILISDADEIPSLSFLQLYLKQEDYVLYAQMEQFRYNLNIKDLEKWIGSVKCHYDSLNQFSINTLRFAYKRNETPILRKCLVSEGGWHFTSFGTETQIKNKLDSWGHQELNTNINRFFVGYRLQYGFDIFGREIDYNIALIPNIPDELMTHLNKYMNYEIKKPTCLNVIVNRIIWVSDRIVYRMNNYLSDSKILKLLLSLKIFR